MTSRKQDIINILKNKDSGIRDLLMGVNNRQSKKVSKITVIRDLDKLIKDDLVARSGSGPSVRYKISPSYMILNDADVDRYFSVDPDRREARSDFNLDVFDVLGKMEVLTTDEKSLFTELQKKYTNNINGLPPEIIRKELERLTIEMSWKSSKIEGNTYDLLETEFLLKENREALGHTRLEAQMIINHKNALELVQKEKIQKITLENIQKVHNCLTKDMGIMAEIRNKPVGITGTIYKPLSNNTEIEKALIKMCELINAKENVVEKSLLLNLLIAYIQPFNDGNKRTSRLMGNAILVANNHCPLSFRSIDELEYKKAIIMFYEQNNLRYFKELFIEQYRFAVENYFN